MVVFGYSNCSQQDKKTQIYIIAFSDANHGVAIGYKLTQDRLGYFHGAYVREAHCHRKIIGTAGAPEFPEVFAASTLCLSRAAMSGPLHPEETSPFHVKTPY